MRRGRRDSGKLFQNFNEFDVESSSNLVLNTDLQKGKEGLEKDCCRPVRNKSRTRDTKRTKSVSPPSIFVAPPVEGHVSVKKLCKLYSKTVVQLQKVKSLTEDKENETENLLDLRRQLQRADEFSIRFSRNNLYEAKRIINEVKNLILPHPFEGLSPNHCRTLYKRIIVAFQAASQALQCYINFVKNPFNLEIPEKISELVLIIADLFLSCENLSLPLSNAMKSDAVKICNELILLLKTKTSMPSYVELKEADLVKHKTKKIMEEKKKPDKFSMYKTKTPLRPKMEVPRKRSAISCFLSGKARQPKIEKNAKITHEIYTQKLSHSQWEGLGNKTVKFKPEDPEKVERPEMKKPTARKIKFRTGEVKSQDDDVETMIQSIGDDEFSTSRLGSVSSKSEEGEISKTYFKQLLLETIEELQNEDVEDKTTLAKLLNSIQDCKGKLKNQTPRPDKVKVYHMLSNDLLEEKNSTKKDEETLESKKPVEAQDEPTVPEKTTTKRRLSGIFKPVRCGSGGGDGGGRGRIQLKLSQETMNHALKYRKAFGDFQKNNIMYKKTLANKPWELVGKVSDHIILDIINEIAMDFQNDALLRRLYLSELLEVTS